MSETTRCFYTWDTDSGTAEVVLDVDEEVSEDFWKQANEFWGGAEDRERRYGSHREAYLRQLVLAIFAAEIEWSAKYIWEERRPEGFFAIDGSDGVTLVSVDPVVPEATDLEVRRTRLSEQS